MTALPRNSEELARWKGKKRDEGQGGAGGSVLSMTMVGDGLYSAIYTVPISVGSNGQTFGVQVDTGSSDLWIASTSCSSSACTSKGVSLYNPSVSSTQTGQTFQIPYLSGSASGPIVWDQVMLGGYQVDNQALAAATAVANESLQQSYSGILGLALPLNSIIAQDIPPTTSNNPDGAAFSSNLFGITPSSHAPSQPFFSLLLERPGSKRVPSLLGIGMHPTAASLNPSSSSSSSSSSPPPLTIDPSHLSYSSPITDEHGALFWKAEVRAITVYVDGVAHTVDIGRGASGGVFPEAVLDSGVPWIIAAPALANGIWGALGVSPANDGNYYLPCTTPLNITITLDDRAEIPLHPLDLTAIPQNSADPSSEQSCMGLITQNAVLDSPASAGDIILGVPFLRSVYMVMEYESDEGIDDAGAGAGARTRNGRRRKSGRRAGMAMKRQGASNPRLGLLNITDPTVALQEFHNVRVLNQPLDASSNGQGKGNASSSGRRIPVGVEVLFGLAGFVGLCVVLFGARWFVMRRRARKGRKGGDADDDEKEEEKDDGEEQRELDGEWRGFGSHVPSEDSERTLHHNDASPGTALPANKTRNSHNKLDSSSTTRHSYGYDDEDEDEDTFDGDRELGFLRTKRSRMDGAAKEEGWRESWLDSYAYDQPAMHGEWRPASEGAFSSSHHSHRPSLTHERHGSNFSATSSSRGTATNDTDTMTVTPPGTPGTATVTMPLLPRMDRLETRLDARLLGSTVESLSDFAISDYAGRMERRSASAGAGARPGSVSVSGGAPRPFSTSASVSETGVLLPSRRDRAVSMGGGDTSASIMPIRPGIRIHGRTSSGLRSSSMTNVVSASDVEESSMQ